MHDLTPSWFFRSLPRGDQWFLLYKYRMGRFDPMLRKYLDDLCIEQLPVPMHTVTVDLIGGESVVRSAGDAVHGILESINLPVLSKPINRPGQALVDGGLINNIPADVLVSKGCNFVIAVSVTAKMDREFARNRPDTPISKMRSASTIQTILRSFLVQSTSVNAIGVQPADFVIEPDVSGFELTEFSRTDELAAIGEQATRNAIPQIKQLLEPTGRRAVPDVIRCRLSLIYASRSLRLPAVLREAEAMNAATLVNLLTIAGLVAIMLSMGFKVTFAEVAAPMRKPRLVVNGLLANFVLAPAATAALLYLFDADPLVSVGFLILAVCPGAPLGPPFTAVAKGDVPYATGQMVILAGLSALLSPALLSLMLPRLFPAGDLHIDYLAIVETLLVSQMLPLGIGLSIHHFAPKFTSRIVKPVGLVGNLLLVSVVALALVQEYESLASIRPRGWIAMALLLAATIGIGWVCGGPARATRKALAVTTGVRNAAVALVIVSGNFADTAAVTAVVAYALVSIFATLGCAFLLAAAPEIDGVREGSSKAQ